MNEMYEENSFQANQIRDNECCIEKDSCKALFANMQMQNV